MSRLQSFALLLEIAVLIIALQTTLGQSLCPDSNICIQVRRGNKPEMLRYEGTEFPNIEDVFRKKNVSVTDIERLEIRSTKINEINPVELGKLTQLSSLYIQSCKNLKTLPPNAFKRNKELVTIDLTDNSIETMSNYTFDGVFEKPSFRGELHLSRNKLTSFPRFSTNAPGLQLLTLDRNLIRNLNERSLKNVPQLEKLIMRNSALEYIGDNTFNAKMSWHLAVVDFSGSANLADIKSKAFSGAKRLKTLILDNTKISKVPSNGLSSLVTLSLKGVSSILSVSDDVINLPKLAFVYLSEKRRYLCCAFKYRRSETIHETEGAKVNFTKDCRRTTTKPTTATTDTNMMNTKTMRTTEARTVNGSTQKPATTTEDPWGGGGWGRRRRNLLWFGDWIPASNTSTDKVKTSHQFTDDNFGTKAITHASVFFECGNNTNLTYVVQQKLNPVTCDPAPDALRPCDDIMGDVALTTLSWIVSFLAVLSNGIVFGVLLMSRRHFTVTKFLIINLAFADLCLGLYLFVLTCASIDTTGKYYNSIFSWQYNGGCDVIGFLAIFSSELSMLILTVITIERYLAIVYAVYLQKRLSLRQARLLTGISWAVAALLAVLPLAGVNNYREVAICLPFSISNTIDIVYLSFLFAFNSLLFVIILACYVQIYLAVAGPNSSGRPPAVANDSAVAKRIALLVFTDFACWLPIAVVGMIAAAGYSSRIAMTVEKSKYLLVIFFPINSICNPFLYALSTKTFRREFYTVLAQCGFCRDKLHQFQSHTFTGQSNNRKTDRHKMRRVTETINLSTMQQAEINSAASNGKAPIQRASDIGRVGSPTSDPLILDYPASPSKNNNNALPNGHPTDDPNVKIVVSESSIAVEGEDQQVALSSSVPYVRGDSRIPLTEAED